MAIQVIKKNMCTGCQSCLLICPKKCITMQEDDEGFLYPTVKKEKCIECNLCVKVCPVLKNYSSSKNTHIKAYAAYNRNNHIRMQSSSGGIFTSLAEIVLDQGGVVFGAAFNEDFSVSTVFIDNKEDVVALQGSKYVQSDIGESFKLARDFLNAGILVLFSGTPCQIGGLYAYLKTDYKNLITVDLICHGVPSPLVWRKYIDYRKKKSQSDIDSISFRNKKNGWKDFSMSFKFKNNTEYLACHDKDPFMRIFLNDLCLRPSCYNCLFKTKSRLADITLADFWGIEKTLPNLDDNNGTSIVIINSLFGMGFFEKISKSLNYCDFEYNLIEKYNYSYLHSAKEPIYKKKFCRYIKKYDFDIAYIKLKKYIQSKEIKDGIKKDIKKMRFRRMSKKVKLLMSDKKIQKELL